MRGAWQNAAPSKTRYFGQASPRSVFVSAGLLCGINARRFVGLGLVFQPMSDESASATPSLRVFLSYSRIDSAFVDEIAAGLPLVGNFDVRLDRHSIETGVEWQERLEDLIEEADAVVFILSPDFVKSDICAWEVNIAARLGKRLVPLLLRPLGDALAPAELGVINYVDATTSSTMIATLKTLGNTLKTDLEWLKRSTRLLNLAQDWNEAGRPDNRLLLAADVETATAWLKSTPVGVEITDLQRDFVNASSAAYTMRQDAEQQRLAEVAEANARTAEAAQRGQKRARKLTAVSMLGAAAAFIAFLFAFSAQNRAEMAEADALMAKLEAEENRVLADQERELANEAKGEFLRDLRKAGFVIERLIQNGGFSQTGFNCAGTVDLRQPIEFVLCTNETLAAEERALSATYFAFYGALENADKRWLKDEQRGWIRSRYLDCTLEFDNQVTDEEIAAIEDCGMRFLKNRNAQLVVYESGFKKLGRYEKENGVQLTAG